jgi:alpha,alpha-trehalose phosphorylase
MVRENLWCAVGTIEMMQRETPELYNLLVDKTGLEHSEIEAWQKAADAMYIPYDEAVGIIPQDDTFMDDKPWDFDNTPPDKYPLLLFYQPLMISSRRRLCWPCFCSGTSFHCRPSDVILSTMNR